MAADEFHVKRKLQELGSGSYFVVLPKIWIERENLKKGDEVSVYFDRELRIEARPSKSNLR